MPGETGILPFQRIFSSEEFERIRLGLVPAEMEDKWFIYYDDHILNFHRSWTGHHIYAIALQALGDNRYQVTKAIVNRNSEQYNQQDNSFDASLLGYLIDRLLLGKAVPFPVPADVPQSHSGIFKHSMVGHATPNVTNEFAQLNMGDRVGGCLIGGAIGDAIGSFYEGKPVIGKINMEIVHGITDDTQLTMATCESIIDIGKVSAAGIARHMLSWYNRGKLTGLGASTLKALRDLQIGAHWALSGRSGEYAAGNGAAMRIAPLAFFVNPETDRTVIRDVCNITHKNDEAYVGSLAILYALHYVLMGKWKPGVSLAELITPQLPDSSVRDNLLKLQSAHSMSIREAGRLVGCSGHVIESVPFSIFAAGKIRESSFEDILSDIILSGGDTDTNGSLAGQIMGAHIGFSGLPVSSIKIFMELAESVHILEVIRKLSQKLNKQ